VAVAVLRLKTQVVALVVGQAVLLVGTALTPEVVEVLSLLVALLFLPLVRHCKAVV
jgi:hypothetical protein